MTSLLYDQLEDVLERAHPRHHNSDATHADKVGCGVCNMLSALRGYRSRAKERIETAMGDVEAGIFAGLARDRWVNPLCTGGESTSDERRAFARERSRNIAVALMNTFEPELTE